ncbi:MAG: ribbon-helix-helix protein, CopG family [Gemmatimonadaceae bacterium]|jgi:predicted transcriptional regulator|nr:ribbon-helix-helix protein, CopG family [Gemmatimonadaceae bacterium]
MTKHAKVAVSLPAADLAAAEALARRLDRSRSWVVAEALRRYVADSDRASRDALDVTRRYQLDRDLALTAEERLREAEEVAAIGGPPGARLEQPHRFATYEDFVQWRRARDDG